MTTTAGRDTAAPFGEGDEMLAARVNARIALLKKESRWWGIKRWAGIGRWVGAIAGALGVLWVVRSLCRDDGDFLLVLGVGAGGFAWVIFRLVTLQTKKIERLEARIHELEERQAAEVRRRLATGSRPPMSMGREV